MNGTKYIINKELARVFKDKKMIFSLFILPVIIMVAIYGIMGLMISSTEKDIATHISQVYVMNAPEGFEKAVAESGFDQTADITYLEANAQTEEIDNIKNDILEERAELLISFDKDYITKVKSYANDGNNLPEVTISYNNTSDYSKSSFNIFQTTALKTFEDSLLAERIGGLDTLKISSLSIDYQAKEAKANGQFLAMLLPYLIVMMLFAGAMSVGVDAIAGEKERGTLASMLLTPIKRTSIAMGKIIALSMISGLSAIVYAVALIFSMPNIAGAMGGGGSVSFSVLQIVELILIMVALVYMFVGLISLIAVLSKSVKEASSYVAPFYIVVIVAGMMTMFSNGAKATYLYAIPIYGNALAIKDIMVNELTTVNFLVSLSGVIVISAILTGAIAKAFNSEKIMFNA